MLFRSLRAHDNITAVLQHMRQRGFRIYGTHLGTAAVDYRQCDFTGPTAFVLGAEKWGLSADAAAMVDQPLFIPMGGMVQSLNVSVAAAVLLFEALRQRQAAGRVPEAGEGLDPDLYRRTLFEWAYPEVARWCRQTGRDYPGLDGDGNLLEALPRDVRLRC